MKLANGRASDGMAQEDSFNIITGYACELVQNSMSNTHPLSERELAKISVLVELAARRRSRLGIELDVFDLTSETIAVLDA